MKKTILTVVGGVMLAGSLLGAGMASADPPYATCKAAAADGKYNITNDDQAYAGWLDGDGDGVACEKKSR